MEENNVVFLVGDDVLVYLAELMHKKYSTAFVWGHPFSTPRVSYDRFFNSFSLYTPVLILDDPPPPPPPPQPPFFQLRTYLMDGLFLNQKTNKNIRISYLLKYKHSKKNSLQKNKW